MADEVLKDKRELVLARMVQVIKELDMYKEVYRNRDEVADSVKPAIVVIDGPETVVDQPDERGHRPSNATVLVEMTPEVIVLTDTVSTDTIGTDLNKHRAAIVKAIVTDAQLLTIVGANGKIRYQSFEMALAAGRRVEGQAMIRIAFVYPLQYANL